MFRYSIVLLVLLNVFLTGDGHAQSQGCSLSDMEEYGTCRKWSECQSAQTAYNSKKIPPIYCQYDSIDPIVCCSEPTDQFEKIVEQRISEQKCIEAHTPKPTTTTTPPDDNLTSTDYVAIIAGIRTAPKEFTHMAAIGWKNTSAIFAYNFLCGGTLISENFVLTAAHCSRHNGVAPSVARIGGENLVLNTFDSNIPITRIFVNPQYKRKQVYHDIALMELKTSTFHKPACLWQTDDIDNKDVIAIGYGHTKFGGKGSNDLLKVFLNIIPNEQCQQYYQPGYRFESGISKSQICAGDLKKIQDTCQGDSGGPLMIKVRGIDGAIIPYILGVTSFGQGCAGGPPSIYVKVSSYLHWIESIVWPS